MEKNIKDYLGKELKQYVLANTIIIFLFYNLDYHIVDYDLNNVAAIWKSIVGLGAVGSAFYIYVLLLDAVYTPWMKEKCVHWCFPMPGCTVFEMIRKNQVDKRFTSEQAQKYYVEIYEGLDKLPCNNKKYVYQNSRWYSIYDKYKNRGSVWNSNRCYLLCRDICVATINLLVASIVVSKIFDINIPSGFFVYLSISYLVVAWSARAQAKRLVYNVIACDIAGKENGE